MPSQSEDGHKHVTRRRFIEATGAAGIASTAGCSSDDGSGSGGDGDQSGSGNTDNQDSDQTANGDQTVVTWAVRDDVEDVIDDVRESLWDAGLSEDIYVEFQEKPPGSTNEQLTQYQTWLNGGREKPDIIEADSAWSYSFVQRGQLASLDGRVDDDVLQHVDDNFAPQLIPAVKSQDDGEYYGLPFQTDVPTIAYRKDLVKDAGFKPDEEEWGVNGMSWEKFSQVIAETLENSDVDYGHTFVAAPIEGLACCTFNEAMTSFGGAYFGGRENLYGPIGERPVTVTEEGPETALRMLRTFINGHDDEYSLDDFEGDIAPAETLQWNADTSAEPFLGGNAVASRSWPNDVVDSVDEFGHDKIGVMPMPSGVSEDEAKYPDTGGVGRSFIGGWVNVINGNSNNVDAAAQVLEAMVQNEEFRSILMDVSVVPPDLSMMERLIGDVPEYEPYVDTFTLSAERGIARASTPIWPTQSSAISQEINASLQQEKTPQEALSDLEEQLEAIENENAE